MVRISAAIRSNKGCGQARRSLRKAAAKQREEGKRLFREAQDQLQNERRSKGNEDSSRASQESTRDVRSLVRNRVDQRREREFVKSSESRAPRNRPPQTSPPTTSKPSSRDHEHVDTSVTAHLRTSFLLHLPPGHHADGETFPLILFLHGVGERGSDVERVAQHGLPKIVRERPEFPFIVVSPQCPDGQIWSTPNLLALLDYIGEHYPVDQDRVYVTGLSMGGYGTWSFAAEAPDRIAAAAPVCGGGSWIQGGRSRAFRSGRFTGRTTKSCRSQSLRGWSMQPEHRETRT